MIICKRYDINMLCDFADALGCKTKSKDISIRGNTFAFAHGSLQIRHAQMDACQESPNFFPWRLGTFLFKNRPHSPIEHDIADKLKRGKRILLGLAWKEVAENMAGI